MPCRVQTAGVGVVEEQNMEKAFYQGYGQTTFWPGRRKEQMERKMKKERRIWGGRGGPLPGTSK